MAVVSPSASLDACDFLFIGISGRQLLYIYYFFIVANQLV